MEEGGESDDLLPYISEQHEVLHVVRFPIRILLYCLQSSRLFISLVVQPCYYKKSQSTLTVNKLSGNGIAGFPHRAFVSIKKVKVVGYQRKYANENGDP